MMTVIMARIKLAVPGSLTPYCGIDWFISHQCLDVDTVQAQMRFG
jgi:hypothetical protein